MAKRIVETTYEHIVSIIGFTYDDALEVEIPLAILLGEGLIDDYIAIYYNGYEFKERYNINAPE